MVGPVWTQELHELQLTGGGKSAPHLWAAPHAPRLGGAWGQAGQGGAQALRGKLGPKPPPLPSPGRAREPLGKASLDPLSSGGCWTGGWGPWGACGRVGMG